METNNITFLQLINNNPMILITVIAVITPLITAFISNSYALRMKKLELQAEINQNVLYKEIDILLDALSGLGNISGAYRSSEAECARSSSAILKAVPYIEDKTITDLIISICLNLRSGAFPDNEQVKQVSNAFSIALNKRYKASQ